MIPDKSLAISEGAIQVMGWQSCTDPSSYTYAILQALSKEYQFDLDTPYQDLPEDIHDILLHGTNGKSVKVYYKGQRGEGVYDVAFEGLIKNVERRYRETGSETSKQEYESFMRITPCKACKGQRLKKESLAVTVCDKNIYEITTMSIKNLSGFLEAYGADKTADADRRTDLKRNPCQSGIPHGCWTGLSDTCPCNRKFVRRRSTAYPTGNTDRLRSGGRCLYFGRAEYRTAPER